MSSGCGDVLSLADLQTAKKHQIFEAEVITGKQGGVASGADIDYATNQVTGQTQKTLPAVLRDAGFRPAPFTFTTGGTLTVTDADMAVLWPIADGGDGNYYAWKGALPKVVPANSSPATTGGVSDSAWVAVSEAALRSDLASVNGAGMVGVLNGGTVQTEFDSVNESLDSLAENRPNLSLGKVKVWAELDLRFPGYATLIASYGYSYLYPQALAFFDEDNEFYIAYQGPGGSNQWGWIGVYDSTTKVCKSVFSAGDFNSEGLHIARVGGVKYLVTLQTYSGGGAGKTGVYVLPSDLSSINLTRLTATQVCNTQHYFQMSGFGNFVVMEVNAGNSGTQSLQARSQLRVYKVTDLVATPDPVAVGSISLSRNSVEIGKRQAFGVGLGEIVCGVGAFYQTSSPTFTDDQQYGCRVLNMDGSTKAEFIADPKKVADLIQPHIAGTITRIENEGAAYSASSGQHRPYTLHPVGNVTTDATHGLIILEQAVTDGEEGIDISSTQTAYGFVDRNNDSSIQILERPYDRTQNKLLTTIPQILDRMNRDGIQLYRFYNSASWPVTDVNGDVISSSTTVTIHNNNSFTYTVEVLGNGIFYTMLITGDRGGPYTQGVSKFIQAMDTNVRPEFLKATGIVAGVNGLPCLNFYTNTVTGSTTTHRFITGVASGAVGLAGSISVNNATNTTAYNTTSDVSLKNDHGSISGSLDILDEMFGDGAFRNAAFISNPDNVMPMLMAQHLNKTAPYAVTPGDEVTGDPWAVDYSKLVPLMLAMIHELSQKLK